MASIGICAKILSTIASPALKMAYEKGLTIWEAKNELNKLRLSIETLQAFLNDAENRQEDSDLVRNWIQRLKGVLYDAEDLFDEVLTEDLCKQQMMDGTNKLSLKNKVQVYCSKLNPIVSRNSISKKVKSIRERLAEISTDMNQFTFVKGEPNGKMSESYTARCYIDAKCVIGRNLYKDSIMEMLFNALPDTTDAPVVIAIDGIGGMGKTTLAHLIYSDEKVDKFFDKRGFACISKSFDDKEFLEKVYQSISEENCSGLTLIQLQEKLSKSLKDQKYLLVLDDVWEEDHVKWTSRKSVLSSGSDGSRIIVTTRLPSVVMAMGAIESHSLEGLSEDESWELFKNLAFARGHENDSKRERVGRKMLKKCRGVPLAISCMGSLLYNKTIGEWEEIERVSLPMLKGKDNDKVISILKLSFDYLPPNLKQCFIYCCLFPKDHKYSKVDLIHHWIGQGYINSKEGESSFMYLVRMGFFQEVKKDEFDEIKSCKMHDIMHDLALHLKGEEIILPDSTNVSSCTRHVSLTVDGEDGGIWNIPTPLLDSKLIRSCILRRLSSQHSQPNVDQLCSNFKLLRTLALADLGIEHIPDSIGELKLVRYLDLSWNRFERLPDSIAKLVNLIILDINGCKELTIWPLNFKKLINLRSLQLKDTPKLLSMPEGIGGLVSLQNLSHFKVEKWSQLHEFTELLERLRGCLEINFAEEMEVGNDQKWQIPDATSLQDLTITFYPGRGIWGWGNNDSEIKLERLVMKGGYNVIHLAPMSCLPCLKWLAILYLPELEYVEVNPATSQEFFPALEKLELSMMLKLKGWWRDVATEEPSTSSASSVSPLLAFSHLSDLFIYYCPKLELKSFPQCPRLRKVQLFDVSTPSGIFCSSNYSTLEDITISKCKSLSGIPFEVLTSLQRLIIDEGPSLKTLHLASPRLQHLEIKSCDELVSVELPQRPSLQHLRIDNCTELLKSFQRANQESAATGLSLSSLSLSSLRVISVLNYEGPISIPFIQLASLETCEFETVDGLQSLHIPSPHLRSVSLTNCVGLTSVEVKAPTHIKIDSFSDLRSFCIAQPTALQRLEIYSTSSALDWGSLMSTLSSLKEAYFHEVSGLKTLNLSSPHLITIKIGKCSDLTRVVIASPFTRSDLSLQVYIHCCSQLNNVRFPRSTALRRLKIYECPELSLSTGVDWASLPNLKQLELSPLPPVEELQHQLPQGLLQRHALRELQITEAESSFWG